MVFHMNGDFIHASAYIRSQINNNIILWQIVYIFLYDSTTEFTNFFFLFCSVVPFTFAVFKRSIDGIFFLLCLSNFQHSHTQREVERWQESEEEKKKAHINKNKKRTNDDTAGCNIVVQQPNYRYDKLQFYCPFYFGYFSCTFSTGFTSLDGIECQWMFLLNSQTYMCNI